MGFLSAIRGISTNLSDAFSGAFSSGPDFNIDGAPMVGEFDINGNVYGVTQDDHIVNDAFLHDSSLTDMGIESSTLESSSSIGTDDCFSSSPIFTDDSFSSSFDVDDTFSSDFSSCDDTFSSSWDD